jgi:hypothetical protein
MSTVWRDPESAASEGKGQGGGNRVVAKVLVGSEWVVVTMPTDVKEGNEPNEGDLDSDPSE